MTAPLTDIRPLRYTASVNVFAELRLIIIDVMEFDGELSLWLQLLTCPFVNHCGLEDIKSFLFPIQAASGMQVTIILIDDKDGAGPLTGQNILD